MTLQSLSDLSRKWSLTDLFPISHQGVNPVFAAQKNHAPVIVKIIENSHAFADESQALAYFQNQGAVKLIDTDVARHALLLEKIQPGTALKTFFPLQDIDAVHIAAKLIQRLQTSQHRLPTYSFKTLRELTAVLETTNKNALPHTLLSTAIKYAKNLLKQEYNAVLHGDLHHGNILLSDKQDWIAIDPKGVIGDPIYEAATFMINPMPELLKQNNVRTILQDRLQLFSKLLNYDIQHLYEWTLVRAAIGACWAIEDKQSVDYFTEFAETLRFI